MKVFNLNIGATVLRLYFMMLVVIVAGFMHIWALAILALPIFLSSLLGVTFSFSVLGPQTKSLGRKLELNIRRLRVPVHQTA